MTRTKAAAHAGLPDTYFEWVKRHPLASIRTEADLDAAQAVLLSQTLDDDGALTYLEALSDLVLLYERESHAVPPLPPHELLTHLLGERGRTQAELIRRTGIAKATVRDLAAGKRPFTVDHMPRIAAAFGVPAAVFLAAGD